MPSSVNNAAVMRVETDVAHAENIPINGISNEAAQKFEGVI